MDGTAAFGSLQYNRSNRHRCFTGNRVDIIIVVDVVFSQIVTTVGRVSTGGEALTFSVFSGAVKAFDGGGSASIIADTFLKPL